MIEFGALAFFAAVALGAAAIGWSAIRAALAGFAAASLVYSVFIAIVLQRADTSQLPGLAAQHDQRASIVFGAGLVIDFAALALIIHFLTTRQMDAVAVALAFGAIIGAWVLLNMLFAIHYAHAYFLAAGEAPPLAFPGEGRRAFSDFVYFAFVTGMTFQVSDVAVTGATMRRLVLAHSLLAFLFNVFVLALSVNAVGSFI